MKYLVKDCEGITTFVEDMQDLYKFLCQDLRDIFSWTDFDLKDEEIDKVCEDVEQFCLVGFEPSLTPFIGEKLGYLSDFYSIYEIGRQVL